MRPLGYNVSTLHQETFSSNDFDKTPKSIMGDGDGTVPIESLTFCKNWIGMTNNTYVLLVWGSIFAYYLLQLEH